jgi:glycosyltransferase involved in cell wall biosynthesis
MTMDTNLNYYQKGLELAEAGSHQEALICIQEHLRTSPNDAQALNDAGTILHCLGRSSEAVNHLVRARSLCNDSAEITCNLVEAYLAAAMAEEASQLFNEMEQRGQLNADVLNRTAGIFADQGNKAQAIEMLLWSLRIMPEQEVLNRMIEAIQIKRPRTTFFCGLKGDVKFLTDIYEFAKRRLQVQFAEGLNVEKMYELMRTSDICWFEWCTDVVVAASKLPKVSKNIVRLHRFEAYSNWPSQVKWENIDVLILVGNSFVKDTLLSRVPDIEHRTRLVTIPNGVNLDRFRFVDRQRGKNIACAGYLNMRKNPMLLLQCMQKLHYIDPEYKLFFAGVFQDPMLEQYVRHMIQILNLTDVVFFDGWQKDVNSWLADKHYVVSGSIGESQGMGLLEAMACGLKPVIHNFPGASQIFPSEFLFNISEEFCAQILSDNYEPQRYRKFVEDNYSLKNQLKNISLIFNQFEMEIDLQRITAPRPNLRLVNAENDSSPAEFNNLVFENSRL